MIKSERKKKNPWESVDEKAFKKRRNGITDGERTDNNCHHGIGTGAFRGYFH
jgi:hypothetical protein